MSPLRITALVVTLSLGAACRGNPTPVAPAATGGPGTTSATPQPSMAKVIVGFSEIYEGALPMWYAQDKGIFAKNFVDADLRFTASSTGIAALLANEIQIFQGGGSETLAAHAQGADLLLIGNLVPIYPYVFLPTPGLNTLT